MSSLTVLGSGTCQIEPDRRASSVLIELDGTYVLFDCGHGVVQRLLEAGVHHNEVSHVVLSHFHPDHVSDLIPFLHAAAWSRQDPRTTDVYLYGPPGLVRFTHQLLGAFEFDDLHSSAYEIHLREMVDDSLRIKEHIFDFVSLPPAGNHGLKFKCNGMVYALTGDSHYHDAEIAFLRNVDSAIIDSGHLSDEHIVQLAAYSQAKRLICSHLYRDVDAERLQVLAERLGYTGQITKAHDLLSFRI